MDAAIATSSAASAAMAGRCHTGSCAGSSQKSSWRASRHSRALGEQRGDDLGRRAEVQVELGMLDGELDDAADDVVRTGADLEASRLLVGLDRRPLRLVGLLGELRRCP